MANLQYIGARYVPKFFLNPDDQSNDWKSGMLYEALTIVTYNNDSYTSRIVVPDNIGNPADNPDYWACTTKYTAALMALQTTVGIHESEIENLQYKTNNCVTPEEFGAVGDGVTNDFIAVNQAFGEAATSGKTLLLSQNYFISNNVIVSEPIDIIGAGTIIYSGSGVAVTIGSNNVSIGKSIKLNVISDDLDSPKPNTIGILLKNMSGCKFDIFVEGFVNGLVCEGDGEGFQNNIVQIDYIYNCDIGIELRPINSGWVNSNSFIGGKIGYSNSFTPTNGIAIDVNSVSGNTVNNNVFFNQNVEGVLVGIRLNKCTSNEFLYGRFENVTTPYIISDQSNTIQNIIEPCYMNHDVDLGLVDLFTRSVSSFTHKLNIPLLSGIYNASVYACKGITVPSVGTLYPHAYGVDCDTKKVHVNPTRGIGARVNVTSKYIMVDVDSNDEWRLRLVAYNGDTPINEHIRIIYDTEFHGYTAETTTSTWSGMSTEVSSAAKHRRIAILPDTCDNVLIIITSKDGASTLDISNIEISSTKGLGLITMGNSDVPLISSIPTSTPSLGTVVYSDNPDATTKGWIYSSNGWITI